MFASVSLAGGSKPRIYTQNGMENVNIDRVEQFQDAAQGHFGPPQLQLVSEALVERSI